jgi:uncharacterized protein YfiM (DUF2279 family)
MAQIIGFAKLKTAASAAAVNDYTKGAGGLTAIAALGEHGAHTIFEGGSGSFTVDGTIYDNSDGWLNTSKATWSGPNGEVDVIDGKQSGVMNVQGNIESYAANPFDHCFGETGPEPSGAATVVCDVNTSTEITYEGWKGNDGSGTDSNGNPNGSQQTEDPLSTDPGPPPADDAFCGTASPTTYSPGQMPVLVSGVEYGAAIDPPTGYSVTGSDIMLVTETAIPDSAGGTFSSNTGDGEPAVGNGSGLCDLELTYETCGNSFSSAPSNMCSSEPAPVNTAAAGTNCNAETDVANSVSAQGLNYSLEIGGQGTVNLTASTGTGFPWTDFLTWQLTPGVGSGFPSNPAGDPGAPSGAGQANTGLDGEPSDSANITLTGLMYNNSDQTGQNLSQPQYWDGNAGIPFLPGGMLLAGYGVAGGTYGTGLTCGNVTSGYTGGCVIKLYGLAVTDEFQTEGYSSFTIYGSTYQLPGIQGTGAILTQ